MKPKAIIFSGHGKRTIPYIPPQAWGGCPELVEGQERSNY